MSANNFQEEPSKYYVNICRPASKERGKKADSDRHLEAEDGFIHVAEDNGLVAQLWEVRVGNDLHSYIELTDPLGWKDVKSSVIPDSKRMFLRAVRLNHIPRDDELHLAFLATAAVQSSLIRDGSLETKYRVAQWLAQAGMEPAKRLAASVKAVAATKLGAGKKLTKKAPAKVAVPVVPVVASPHAEESAESGSDNDE